MLQESTLLHQISHDRLLLLFKELEQKISDISIEKSEELLTPEQTADFFQKSKDTIENWTKKGYLKKYGIGGAVFYKKTELFDALQRIKY